MQKRTVLIIVLLLAISYTAGVYIRNRGVRENSELSTFSPGAGALVAAGGGAPSIDLRPVETLYSVLRNLREYYVEPIKSSEETAMAKDAVRSMLASLDDPDSRFLEERERKLVSEAQQGIFHGIGAITTIDRKKVDGLTEEHLIILTTLPGSGAELAGLKAGDDIVALDGRSILPFNPYARASSMVDKARKDKVDRNDLRKELEVEQGRIDRGLPVVEAQAMLSAYDEKSLELKVNRAGDKKPLTISVKPGKLVVNPVEYVAPNSSNIAVIKVNLLVSATTAAFDKAVQSAIGSGAKALVLDMRGLVGGDMKVAQSVAGHFIPGKRIGILRLSRGRSETLRAVQQPESAVWNKPVAILVDDSTSRFAELIADTLRYQKGYKLVGQKTAGDSVFTSMVDLIDGSAYIITTGKLTPISGIDYTGKGFVVDVASVRGKTGDNQLGQAIKTLNSAPSGS